MDKTVAERDISEMLSIFRRNIIKASLVGDLKRVHVEKNIHESLSAIFEDLDKSEGIENVARSQAWIILVNSFEAFSKDLFKSMLILNPSLLKNTLRDIDSKWDSKEIADLMNKFETIADKIISKQRLNFQNFDSLKRALGYIGINLEDECYEAEKKAKEQLNSKYPPEKTKINFEGVKLLKDLFTIRHEIVHEGKVTQIDEFNFNVIMIFIQELAAGFATRFCDVPFTIIEKEFKFN